LEVFVSKIYDALEQARKEREAEVIIPNHHNDPSLDLSMQPTPQDGAPPSAEVNVESEMITLYQTITASLPDIERRVVLFIGSRSNEGTSTISKNLARVCSLKLGKSVLLIDLDRSRPHLNVFKSTKPECGLEEVLQSGEPIDKAICQVEDSGLYVMPLFQQCMISPRTLDAAKNKDFWENLREKFDMIIIDTPPATLFPDGLAIAGIVDGVVMVVEAEKTRWQVALSVKEKIQKHGGNILGIVFNKREFYIPEFIYKHL
jgi:capsular exopolysaccharide synthesis family protein